MGTDGPLPAGFNDNLRPAGTRSGGVLRVALELRRVEWRPLGSDIAGEVVPAFVEVGKPAALPGPLLRVPLGTELRVTVTNTLDAAFVVHGLSARRRAVPDSLLVRPGETREARFQADAEGSYFYWAARPDVPFDERLFRDSQLNGAFVVDPSSGRTDDRIFLISQYLWPDSTGAPDGRELLTINGRPWPLTERLTYTVGDSVRWRWINASENSHPLHLHGFYFRVDARGDAARDTVYWPGQQRMAVTELLDAQETMRIVWSPERPGGWIFHCHLTFHILPNGPLGTNQDSVKAFGERVFDPKTVHEPAHHVERAMGGLILGMYVRPQAGMPAAVVPERTIRLFVQRGKVPGDTNQRYAYVRQEGQEPARDSVTRSAPTLVLYRGEPTAIRVINRTPLPTVVHWHGLEIQSPFDGVVGVGGYQGSPVPPILPGDSFEVRVTPPRSGSFMYHTHMQEIFQQSGGLWGPLLVLERGQQWDREHDRVFQVGSRPADGEPVLNGEERHDTLRIKADGSYRFRLMNVTLANPALQFWLVRAGAPVRWTQLARDGYDLPPWQRNSTVARLHVGIGETKDVEVRIARPGNLALELRAGNGNLLTRQQIKVEGPDSLKR
jgi:FtsP/CotA-like multicopper oxidase with cupredoxin domain